MVSSTERGRRAVVFDLDGTLVDSMPMVVAMFTDAVAPFRDRPSEEEVLSKLGGPLDTCVRNLLGPDAAARFPEARERMLAFEREHLAEMRMFPGARELLSSLASLGIPLGIWTGRDQWSADKILGAHGLSGYFGALVYGDTLRTHKPDPEGLLRVMDRLGVRPANTVFVGDADVDVIGGRRAGARTVLILHGRESEARGEADEAHQHAEDAYRAVLSRVSAG